MPTFPDDRRPISTDVPGVSINPGAYGQVEEAIGGLGQRVVGTTLPLLQQMKEAEARSAASRAHSEDMIEAERFSAQLKLQSADGYMRDEKGQIRTNADGTQRTMSQEYTDWANERYQRSQEKLPSELAQQIYQERSGSYFTSERVRMEADETARKAQYFAVTMDENLQKFSDQAVSTPEVDKVYQFSNSITEDVMSEVGRSITAPIARERVTKSNQQLAESVLEGGYNQVLSIGKGNAGARTQAVAYWRSVLKGNDLTSLGRKAGGLPTISEMLDPDRKATIEAQFLRLSQQAKELDMSDLNAQRQEAEAAYRMGKGFRVPRQHLDQLIDAHVNDKSITPFEASRIKSSLSLAEEVGRLKKSGFMLMSPAEQDAAIERSGGKVYSTAQKYLGKGPDTKTAGSAAEADIRAGMARLKEESTSNKLNDFAQYMAENDPGSQKAVSQLDFSRPETFAGKRKDVQESISRIDTFYGKLLPGAPEDRYKRIISKNNSKILGQTLASNNLSTEQTAQQIKSLAAAYGERYPELIDQLIEDGSLSEDWRFAAVQPGQLATEDIVGAIKGAKSEVFKKNFETVAGATVKEQDFGLEVSNQLGAVVQAMSAQSPNSPRNAAKINALTNSVKNKAMQIYVADPSVGVSEAVKRARQTLVGDHYHFAEIGGAGGFIGIGSRGQKAVLQIPKRVGSLQINDLERDRITQFANDTLRADEIKKLGGLPPPQKDGKPSKFEDKFFDQVESTGYWTLSRDQRGMNLWYTDRKANRPVQVFTKNSRGQIVPLFVPFETAVLPQGEVKTKPPVYQPGGN